MSKMDGVCTLPVGVCTLPVGVCTGNWLSFCFLHSKVCRATGHLTIGFHEEVTGCLLYATGHLYCCFSALILDAVAAIQLPE